MMLCNYVACVLYSCERKPISLSTPRSKVSIFADRKKEPYRAVIVLATSVRLITRHFCCYDVFQSTRHTPLDNGIIRRLVWPTRLVGWVGAWSHLPRLGSDPDSKNTNRRACLPLDTRRPSPKISKYFPIFKVKCFKFLQSAQLYILKSPRESRILLLQCPGFPRFFQRREGRSSGMLSDCKEIGREFESWWSKNKVMYLFINT